jgi:hypothetical protein
MNGRLITSLVAAGAIVFVGAGALGSAISPTPLKVIATVVAHPRAETHWVARAYAHGL